MASVYWPSVFALSLFDAVQPSDLATIALLVALEGLLSADNAMVLAVLVLGLPRQEQQKALRYGILGAFAFRSLATLLAVYLIALTWVKLAGAVYLLYSSISTSRSRAAPTNGRRRHRPPRCSACRRSGRRW